MDPPHDAESIRHPERLTITPHPLRSHTLELITSPETPHPGFHSKQLSESRHLLTHTPKNLFQYTGTTVLDFDGDNHNLPYEPEFPNWNYDPQYLDRDVKGKWRDVSVDVLVVCLSLPFFALAAAVIRVDGHAPEERQEEIFKQPIYVAATLFPLIFSLVIGRLATKLASYHLEQGAKLGLLERLMGSQSFFGTIITQLGLWPLNAVAVCLVILWLLSPFGSQAILRSLTTEIALMDSVSNATYLNTRQESLAANSDNLLDWFAGFTALFGASLLGSAATKNGSRDLWGNPKIPVQSSLLNTSSSDSDGWYEVSPGSGSRNGKFSQYPFLFGIPISATPEGNTSFGLESSYLSLVCHNVTSIQTRVISNPTPQLANSTQEIFVNPGLISPSGPFISSQNITSSTPWAMGYLGIDVTTHLPQDSNSTFSLDVLTSDVDSELPGLLLYQDFTGFQNVTSIYCTPSQNYVESKITCATSQDGRQCSVIRQRTSLLRHAPSTITYLSFTPILQALTSLLPLAAPQISSQTRERGNQVDIFQNYLANPMDSRFIQSALWPAASNSESRFLDIDLEEFGERLAGVLNAFIVGSMPNSTSWLVDSVIPPGSAKGGNASESARLAISRLDQSITVPGTSVVRELVFICQWPWMTVFLLATAAVFAAGVAAAVVRRFMIGRDYLGFVSSLCRESYAVGVPSGGVAMGGLERTRRLKDLKVRLGDVGDVRDGFQIGVGAHLNVGQMGVGAVRGKGAAEVVRTLDRRKLYV